MRVAIEGLELDLPAPPRVGELIAGVGDGRRVAEVVWWIPKTGRDGRPTTAEDVTVHVQLEKEQQERPADPPTRSWLANWSRP